MTLYEIQSDMLRILDQVEEQAGEITPDQEAELDSLMLSRQDKITNWVKYLKNLKADEAALDSEIDELERRRARLRRHLDWSSAQLEKTIGYRQEWKHNGHSLTWRKSVRAEARMPLEAMREVFVRVTEKRELNKTAVRDFIVENGEIPEAELVTYYTMIIK